jgi:hypothetical protein
VESIEPIGRWIREISYIRHIKQRMVGKQSKQAIVIESLKPILYDLQQYDIERKETFFQMGETAQKHIEIQKGF